MNSAKKITLYSAIFILVAGSLLGAVTWSQGFLSQTSSAAGGQQGGQNQAAQSSVSLESATFATGLLPKVTLLIRNVGAVPVMLQSITLQGASSNRGFRSSMTDPNPSCMPSSGLEQGQTCTYTTTTAYLAGMTGGDLINIRATTSVGTFAQAQYTVPAGGVSTAAINSSSKGDTQTAGTPSGQIEFFANLTLKVSSPEVALDKIEGIAYANGGYVAYSTMSNASAYAIMRVPTTAYQQTLAAVRSVGNIDSYSTTSNDVTVKITSLNATLQSYVTERSALLRLENKSTSLDNTLQIYSHLQTINAQIDLVQSQMTNARRLVDYSTITVSMVTQAARQSFSLKLATTPLNGNGHLQVTFMPTVTGGATPYYMSYDFGDGTSSSSQQPVTHYFGQPGDYNVTLTATDSIGNTTERSVIVHVAGSAANQAFTSFVGYASGLFIGVVEGIIEVAAVAVPLVLVAAFVVVPLGRRYLSPKNQVKRTNS